MCLNSNIWDCVLNWPPTEVFRGQMILKGVRSTSLFQTHPVQTSNSAQAWQVKGASRGQWGRLQHLTERAGIQATAWLNYLLWWFPWILWGMILQLVLGSKWEQAEGPKVQPSGQYTRNSPSEKPTSRGHELPVQVWPTDVFTQCWLTGFYYFKINLQYSTLERFHVKIYIF